MTERPFRWSRSQACQLLLALAGAWAVEGLADVHLIPWTHRQAMDYAGLAFLALAVWILSRRS